MIGENKILLSNVIFVVCVYPSQCIKNQFIIEISHKFASAAKLCDFFILPCIKLCKISNEKLKYIKPGVSESKKIEIMFSEVVRNHFMLKIEKYRL